MAKIDHTTMKNRRVRKCRKERRPLDPPAGPTYGESEYFRILLAELLDIKIEDIRNYVRRKGVQEAEVDRIINENWVDVIQLDQEGDIEVLLKENDERQRKMLKDEIIMLFWHYLNYKIKDYYKEMRRTPPAVAQLPAQAIQFWREEEEFLLGLYPFVSVNVEAFRAGDVKEIRSFYAQLSVCAGLNEQELDLLLFLQLNPKKNEYDYKKSLKPYQISRRKKSAFNKLIVFYSIFVDGKIRLSRAQYRIFTKKNPLADAFFRKAVWRGNLVFIDIKAVWGTLPERTKGDISRESYIQSLQERVKRALRQAPRRDEGKDHAAISYL